MPRLGGSVIQYFVFTASELSTSVLDPTNQKRAENNHTMVAIPETPPTATGVKLKFSAVTGYTKGKLKRIAVNTNQTIEIELMGGPRLHTTRRSSRDTDDCMLYCSRHCCTQSHAYIASRHNCAKVACCWRNALTGDCQVRDTEQRHVCNSHKNAQNKQFTKFLWMCKSMDRLYMPVTGRWNICRCKHEHNLQLGLQVFYSRACDLGIRLKHSS